MSGIVSCHSEEGQHIRKTLMGRSGDAEPNDISDELGGSSVGRCSRLPRLSLPGGEWGQSLEGREVALSTRKLTEQCKQCLPPRLSPRSG